MLNTLPKISIVTPSFNQGEFLEECIVSVLSQNYPNLEYIIMDGGSSDNSVEIIKKYEKYLTYWQSRLDGGQYAAIDEGFRHSTGEIMAWLNSDDKYHAGAFYRASYFFTHFSEVEWLTGRQTWWDASGELIDIALDLPVYCRSTFLDKRYNQPFLQQESTFWRRTLWERAGSRLRTDLQFAGDLELWLRFFRRADLCTVDALLGGYRRHGNQKAALHMDLYLAEADALVDDEFICLKRGEFPRLHPAPPPLFVTANDIQTYMNDVCSALDILPPLDNGQATFLLLQLLQRKEEENFALLRRIESFEGSFTGRATRYLSRLTDTVRRIKRNDA